MFIGNSSIDGEIEQNHLKAQTGIYARLDASETKLYSLNYNIDIKSFSIRAELDGEKIVIHSKTNLFTKEQKDAFKNLKQGDTFFIEDALVRNLGYSFYKILKPFKFIIK